MSTSTRWMESKRPFPSDPQIERVWKLLKAGADKTQIKMCCTECRAALKWLQAHPDVVRRKRLW